MPSLGRKFLLAGMGGLNLTHAEPFDNFVTRYAGRRENIEPLLRRCCAASIRRPCASGSTASASRLSSAARAASFRPT